MVSTTHEQNMICSKTHLDGTMHEQTIICRQLFAGHMVAASGMEGKKMDGMIIMIVGCKIAAGEHCFNGSVSA